VHCGFKDVIEGSSLFFEGDFFFSDSLFTESSDNLFDCDFDFDSDPDFTLFLEAIL